MTCVAFFAGAVVGACFGLLTSTLLIGRALSDYRAREAQVDKILREEP